MELLVDTGCSVPLVLPVPLMQKLGLQPVQQGGELERGATTALGKVNLVAYEPVRVDLPLYEPPKEATKDSYLQTRPHYNKTAFLDVFAIEAKEAKQKEEQEETIADMLGLMVADEEPPRRASLPDGPYVALSALTRADLDTHDWLAIIGLPGLKKLNLTLITEMHVLLPIKSAVINHI
jgi:hypothetical protein